ncbi:MAG: metallophosphoesterase family protein [Deltaproteobacteria bacterium]|nr:metallophosphoesterase family protein [Deltaproteobacteria bacterium]
MRMAIISDIHSNFEALSRVLPELDQEEVDLILNLGDTVGYNASPNECLELLAAQPVWSLAGNHDLALLELERAEFFNIIAYQAIVWSRETVLPQHLDFFRNLPLTQAGEGFVACHGTPSSPDAYISFHFQGKRVLSTLRQQSDVRVCFFGHTHRRALWYRDVRGKVALHPIVPGKMSLDRTCHYLINPGSVGQPRDGNPQAAYAIYDHQEFSIQFKSVPYDIAAAQRRILAAGLPEYLAERLAQGI